MVNRNALKAIIVAATCLTPLAAFADDLGSNISEGEVGIGVMGVMGKNSDQAGRYNGLTTTGVDAIGEFDFRGGSPWNSGGAGYFNLTGDNLVFQGGTGLSNGLGGCSSSCGDSYLSNTNNRLANSGEVNFNFGKQGTWETGVYYDAISYTGNVIDSLYTVNGHNATVNPGLLAWGGAPVGGPATGLTKAFYTVPVLTATNAMQPVQTGTRRDILGGNFKYLYGDWTFTGALRHETKEGSMEESFDGPWGGTAFALPIDYTTDRYDIGAAYNTRLYQTSLQYTFSHFHDNNIFVNIPYPFSNTAAPFEESAAYSTPPSNEAHYLTLMTATNAIPNTRVNLNMRVGLEMQGDMFAPDTADPSLTGVASNLNSAMQGTSSNTLNAMARVVQGKLSANSHPIANTDASAFYGFDGRFVTMNQYKVWSGGTGGSSDSAAFTSALYALPQDWLKQNAGGEVGYRIIPQYDTKLTLGYRFDMVDRSNAQVGKSTTNAGTVALSSRLGPQVNSSLSYTHGERSGVLNYLTPWANLAGPAAAGPDPSGAYYQAPMTSDAFKLRADYTPMQNLFGGLFLQFKNENFHYPQTIGTNMGTSATTLTGVGQGVQQDYNLTVGPDLNYRPREDVNLHFFYTYERIFFNTTGNGACSNTNTTAACLGSAGYFQNKYTSAVHTGGMSGDWAVTDKLKLKGEYTLAYGSVMFGEYNGVFVANPTLSYQNVSNYPDIDSLMNNFKLTATYAVAPTMDLLLQGTWTYFHNNDWNDTAGPIQGAGTAAVSILTPGYSSPNYSVATVMTGVKYKF
ncbi:MAG: MtrB/PioB family outer membrane beta-barrel protein [Stellaceae bacterium]|jgi:MtrB/PioB family decaheme-associated outer membrane protein